MRSRRYEVVGTKKSKKNIKYQKPIAQKTETKPVEIKPVGDSVPHGVFLGFVYANSLAAGEINKENPQFPVGSIIVREKLIVDQYREPETVIAMVKREKGFSPQTGDWEFFIFDGNDLKLNSRETVGNCSACHLRAEKTDWVFRDYLK